MTGEQLIQRAIAQRVAKGLGLRIFGEKAEADRACPTQYAKDADQLAVWIASAQRRGYEYEVMAP